LNNVVSLMFKVFRRKLYHNALELQLAIEDYAVAEAKKDVNMGVLTKMVNVDIFRELV